MVRKQIFTLILGCFGVIQPALAQSLDNSLRPTERKAESRSQVVMPAQQSLEKWITEFRPRALAKGITGQTFDQALGNVQFDQEVIQRDRNQSEFTKTIWDYLDTAVSDLRISNGQVALRKWADTLQDIEDKFGVEKEIVTAIWGLESAFGTFRGSDTVINSLATLAFDARRADFFEGELIEALRILQDGDTSKDHMTGSWAGAMGHTQFMPSSFQAHAVDYDGDGKRNIWGDDPKDALASAAAYLKHFGWTSGQPWGVEVQLPDGFDYLLADRAVIKLPSEWGALGVRGLNDLEIEDHGPASVLLPGGAEGAAFLIFSNFEVLEHYNTADAYVVGVGHLADRIRGGAAIQRSWPRHLRALSYDERIELQKRLIAAGFDTQKVDAKMGPLTVGAVRRFQVAHQILADGYPSLALLERLRTQ